MSNAHQPASPLTRLTGLLLWAFVFVMPWENNVVLPGLGTAGRLVGLTAFGIGLLGLAEAARFRKLEPIHILSICFVAWMALSYAWSVSPDRTLNRIVTYAQLLGMMLLIWQFDYDDRRLKRLFQAYVCGSCVSAALTVQNFIGGSDAFWNRYSAAGFDPNDLGLILALSIPMSAYLSIVERSPWKSGAYLLHLPLVAAAILLTASRGAFLACIAGMAFLIASLPYRPRARRTLFILAVVVAIPVGFSLLPRTSLERLATIQDEFKYGTLNDREIIWRAGLERLEQHPFAGVGAGAFRESVEQILGVAEAAHNLFIAILVESGMIGFTLFAALLWTLVRAGASLAPLERQLWLALFATWMIGVFSLSWEWRKPTWLLFSLLAVASHRARARAACAA